MHFNCSQCGVKFSTNYKGTNPLCIDCRKNVEGNAPPGAPITIPQGEMTPAKPSHYDDVAENTTAPVLVAVQEEHDQARPPVACTVAPHIHMQHRR